jgi:hypothetical protein
MEVRLVVFDHEDCGLWRWDLQRTLAAVEFPRSAEVRL